MTLTEFLLARIADDEYLAALAKADERGEVLSEETRAFLSNYLREGDLT